jgi:hypothetical protein
MNTLQGGGGRGGTAQKRACMAQSGCWLLPRSRVLLEKLVVPQLVKNFPEFYRTRRLITLFTTVRHLSLS